MSGTETIVGLDLSKRSDEVAFMIAEPGNDGFRYRAATKEEIVDYMMRAQEPRLNREGWPQLEGDGGPRS